MRELKELIQNGTCRNRQITRLKSPDLNGITDASILSAVQAAGEVKIRNFNLATLNRKFVYLNLAKWFLGMDFYMSDKTDGAKTPGNPSKGIFLCGPTGTGKSVAMEVLWIMSRSIGVKYSVNGELMPMTWNTYRTTEVVESFLESGTLLPFINQPVICFQDLGSEPTESIYMGNRCNVMQKIIEARGDKDDRITLFSSNLKMHGDKLRNLYGDRVASRLRAMCNYFELTGNDLRE